MNASPRLYNCYLCHTQVTICTCCDRGNIYCSKECSKSARRKSCNDAEKRYQATLNGKLKHASRQKAYRARKTKKVTDQGSKKLSLNALLSKAKNKTKDIFIGPTMKHRRCSFCGKPVSDWFRKDFLGSGAILKLRPKTSDPFQIKLQVQIVSR